MRYLISGYYGEGNAGDEAILAGILQEVGRQDPQADFAVLSFDPADTAARHHVAASSTSLRDPQRLASLIRGSDVVLSGGGSLLHEADFEVFGRSFLFREGKLRPIPYFLSVVLAARVLGRPVMWYAQGLGPLHTRAAREAVRLAASASQVVCWRDREAAELASSLGVRAAVQAVVPDPAYALQPDNAEAAESVLRQQAPAWHAGAGRAGYLGICPRPWLERSGFQDHLVRALAQVARETGLGILFLPFQERTDGPLCQKLASRPDFAGRAAALHNVDEPRLLLALLGRARAAVTMRLHAGILAAAAGTPCVPLVYDPKVYSFAKQTGQEGYAVAMEELEEGSGEADLVRALRGTLAGLEERRSRLRRRVEPLRRNAGETARLAVLLAQNKSPGVGVVIDVC